MKTILDPSFKYVPAISSDIRATFRRERERLKRAAKALEAAQKQDAKELEGKLLPIHRIFDRRR